MKKLAFLGICLFSLGLTNNLWAWPPGLRSSSSFFLGNIFKPEIKVASFGDSVASGFNSDHWLSLVDGGTYADHYGKWLNNETNRSIRIRNLAWAGYTLEQILNKIRDKHIKRIQEADLIFLEGGGNDFLDLNGTKFIDLCKPENFFPTLENAKNNFLSIIKDVDANRKENSNIKVLGLYYPLVHETKNRPCILKSFSPSVHISFLIAMSKLNWFLAREAHKRGFDYADVFAHMNCAQKDWAKCKIPSGISESAYTEKILDLDRDGILQDPGDLGWLQKDRTHPNTNGHELISYSVKVAN